MVLSCINFEPVTNLLECRECVCGRGGCVSAYPLPHHPACARLFSARISSDHSVGHGCIKDAPVKYNSKCFQKFFCTPAKPHLESQIVHKEVSPAVEWQDRSAECQSKVSSKLGGKPGNNGVTQLICVASRLQRM